MTSPGVPAFTTVTETGLISGRPLLHLRPASGGSHIYQIEQTHGEGYLAAWRRNVLNCRVQDGYARPTLPLVGRGGFPAQAANQAIKAVSTARALGQPS